MGNLNFELIKFGVFLNTLEVPANYGVGTWEQVNSEASAHSISINSVLKVFLADGDIGVDYLLYPIHFIGSDKLS